VTQFSVSLNTANLDNYYFRASGEYTGFGPGAPPFGWPTFYVAEPPGQFNLDSMVSLYGPPWTPLANLNQEITVSTTSLATLDQAVSAHGRSRVPRHNPLPSPNLLRCFSWAAVWPRLRRRDIDVRFGADSARLAEGRRVNRP
jgi:hypothetical protein